MKTENFDILIPNPSFDQLSENDNEREQWNELEYYLINIGTNVGIGCIWRFSYLMYEGGGGAFLLPYLFSNFVVSFPSLCMLITLGQVNGNGIVDVYKKVGEKLNLNLEGFALTKIFYTLMISTFYVYLLVYNLMFMYDVAVGFTPWLDNGISSEDMLTDLTTYFDNRILSQNDPSGKNV